MEAQKIVLKMILGHSEVEFHENTFPKRSHKSVEPQHNKEVKKYGALNFPKI